MAIKSVRMPGMVEVSDPGTAGAIIPPAHHNMICIMVTGGSGETRSLTPPSFAGQTCTVMLSTDGGGDAVVTASPAINTTGNNTLTFADAGDFIRLFAGDEGSGLAWRVVVNNGVALSTV